MTTEGWLTQVMSTSSMVHLMSVVPIETSLAMPFLACRHCDQTAA